MHYLSRVEFNKCMSRLTSPTHSSTYKSKRSGRTKAIQRWDVEFDCDWHYAQVDDEKWMKELRSRVTIPLVESIRATEQGEHERAKALTIRANRAYRFYRSVMVYRKEYGANYYFGGYQSDV